MIHHPYTFPDVSTRSYFFGMDTSNLLGINPEMTTTTERLKSVSVRNRKCLFPSERKLKMFQIYTRRSCLMECRQAITLKVCKCVPFDLSGQSCKLKVSILYLIEQTVFQIRMSILKCVI